tara:strand:+ start:1607 stop:1942 length:336 start_codon:yes stop_codon:yes gene_type:complete
MVWDQHFNVYDGEHTWGKVPTSYQVGSRDEELFWRVIDTETSTKEYFWTPEDYQSFSGVDLSSLESEVQMWKKRYIELEKEMRNSENHPVDERIASNAATYASFFADGEDV